MIHRGSRCRMSIVLKNKRATLLGPPAVIENEFCLRVENDHRARKFALFQLIKGFVDL